MSLAKQVRAKGNLTVFIIVAIGFLSYLIPGKYGVLIAAFLTIPAGVFIAGRMTRVKNKHVIWLRRFHRNEPKRFRFNKLLDRSCGGLCAPITIQDSAFRTSYLASAMLLYFLAPFLMFFEFALCALCGMGAFIALQTLGISGLLVLGLAGLSSLLPVVLSRYVVKNQWAKRGFIALTAPKAIEEVDAALRKIAKRKMVFLGVLVFKCPDDVWQQVVSLVLLGHVRSSSTCPILP